MKRIITWLYKSFVNQIFLPDHSTGHVTITDGKISAVRLNVRTPARFNQPWSEQYLFDNDLLLRTEVKHYGPQVFQR
jgi:hypothetical protein